MLQSASIWNIYVNLLEYLDTAWIILILTFINVFACFLL